LIEAGGRTHAVEIKQTATPLPGHARGLGRLQQLLGAKLAGESLLVCRVEKLTLLPGGVQALPWQDFPAWVMALAKGG